MKNKIILMVFICTLSFAGEATSGENGSFFTKMIKKITLEWKSLTEDQKKLDKENDILPDLEGRGIHL
jgi:hypothetical protein